MNVIVIFMLIGLGPLLIAVLVQRQAVRRARGVIKRRDAVIFSLARLTESREDSTGKHLDRIRAFVEVLAKELSSKYPQIDGDVIALLGSASSLHDIGKVGIPDAVLLKPGPLTSEERAIIEQHPIIGGDCLSAIKQCLGEDDFIKIACEIAVAHHECWDGSGYPFGLTGDQIPLPARIVAVADVYDALTTARVYKEAKKHDEAREIIIDAAGTMFDPEVVDAFRAREKEFAALCLPAARQREAEFRDPTDETIGARPEPALVPAHSN